MAKLLLVAGLIASAAAAFTANALNVKSVVKPHPNHLVFEKAVEAEKKEKGPSPAFDAYWTDLFAPPYSECPSVMVGISCVNTTTCYIPAGINAVGFGVVSFNGQPGGQFVPMQMKSTPMMLAAISVGIDDRAPVGAVGGMGFSTNAIQYLHHGRNNSGLAWVPSNVEGSPFLVGTQCIRASADGQRILAVPTDGDTPVLLYSKNAGVNFTKVELNVPYVAQGTGLRYAAMPSNDDWYVTAGNWPSVSSEHEDHIFNHPAHAKLNGVNLNNVFALSDRLAVVRCPKTGKLSHKLRGDAIIAKNKAKQGSKDAKDDAPPSLRGGYAAQIFRTKDGGKTFKSVFANTEDSFYFNAIECVNIETCFAVGTGLEGVYIYATRDGGVSWSLAYSLPRGGKDYYSLMSIGVSDGVVIASGGGVTDSGTTYESFVLVSGDYGYTWKKQAGLPNIGDVMSMSLLPGGYGFATAVTQYQSSTVIAMRPQGSPTLPPPPTQPTFSQIGCDDAACSQNCQAASFPQDQCLQVSNGGSAIVRCDEANNLLVQNFYPNSSSCNGSYKTSSMPLNQCLKSAGSEGYFENVCSN